MKRFAAGAVCLMLATSGCTAQTTDVASPRAETAPPVNSQTEALAQAEQAGLLENSTDHLLDEENAALLVTETLDPEQYTASLTDDTLTVGRDKGHNYFVFEVKDTADTIIGKVAIDRATGEKYNYLGDGVLDDYATFPLYDPAADSAYNWAGTYKSPASVTLEVLQGDSSSFSYRFSDGTAGNARISGNTAKSADETLSFLFAEDIITVVGGELMGNYTLV